VAHLQFQADAWSVTYKGTAITLLPKEYALLDFLYRNQGHAFTRDELLDRVWPLETPVDRTVDDHVYRLRKKLKVWADVVSLETVRSIGYRLTLKEEAKPLTTVPSLQDADVNSYVNKMLKRFHLLGQGESMQVLFQQQKVLGVELDPFYELYLRFISGEMVWMAETTDFSLEDRLYFLLVTYFYIQDDREEALGYIERAMESGLLPERSRRELYILDILFPYIMTGRVEKALERLATTTHRVVAEEGIEEGFAIPVALTETAAFLVAGQYERVEANLRRIGAMMETSPYLRESGNYRLACGIWELHNGRREAGKALLDEGFAVLRQSKFVPQYLMFLRLVLFFLERGLERPDLEREYRAMWNELSKRYHLEEAAQKTREVLRRVLL
jgi:DNA-binding winged helix-turn-helix (wHTH) protein